MPWHWFYGSVWRAAIPTRKRQRLAALIAEGPTRSWAAIKTRSALPVSAAAFHPAVKVKANASSQAAMLRASILVAAAVAMVDPSIFFAQWVRVPNSRRLR